MKNSSFGNFIRELRTENRLSLRRFCQITNLDPGNVSRWESGISKPPQSEDTLNKIAAVFGLVPGSDKYKELFYSSATSSGHIPKSIYDNEELMQKLPIFLRTLDGRKLTASELEALINKIKEEQCTMS